MGVEGGPQYTRVSRIHLLSLKMFRDQKKFGKLWSNVAWVLTATGWLAHFLYLIDTISSEFWETNVQTLSKSVCGLKTLIGRWGCLICDYDVIDSLRESVGHEVTDYGEEKLVNPRW